MYVTMRTSIGSMAAVTDESTRASEFLDVNAIGLVSHVINTDSGVAHFTLAFGGVDSKGRFHRDRDEKRAKELCNIVIDRHSPDTVEQQQVFDGLFKDPHGNSKCDYPPSFFANLIRDSLIPLAYKLVWGGKYRDMEVVMNGELIFQPDHLKAAPSTT